jgi:homoserine kinase
VSTRDFFFALNLPTHVPPALLRDVVAHVSVLVHQVADGKAELARLVEDAVAEAARQGGCEVRFEAHRGELGVTVCAGTRPVWQTSRRLI